MVLQLTPISATITIGVSGEHIGSGAGSGCMGDRVAEEEAGTKTMTYSPVGKKGSFTLDIIPILVFPQSTNPFSPEIVKVHF